MNHVKSIIRTRAGFPIFCDIGEKPRVILFGQGLHSSSLGDGCDWDSLSETIGTCRLDVVHEITVHLSDSVNQALAVLFFGHGGG